MNYAPIPELSALAGAGFVRRVSNEKLVKPWIKKPDLESGYLFTRSSHAMRAILDHCLIRRAKGTLCVWVPDYFCNASLELIRKTAAKIVFYAVLDNGRPDWEFCKRLSVATPPDLFFLVHYFGIPNDAKTAQEFCARQGAWLAEDAAHSLLPCQGIGDYGDFTFYSPHKQIAVPDGSVLISREKIHISSNESGTAARRWWVKRAVQRALPDVLLSYFRKLPDDDFFVDPLSAKSSESTLEPLGISESGKLWLAFYLDRLPELARARTQNEHVWRKKVSGEWSGRFDLCPFWDGNEQMVVPYFAVFRASSKENAAKAYQEMRRRGWAVQSWPDLPPEVRANPDQHRSAIALRETCLTLPVHKGVFGG